MSDNKTIYLLLLLFIEEPLTSARNQNANPVVNLGSDFFFACIQTIDTLENEGTIFADAEFLKVASHIHQKINDLQAMISSTVSFLSTFIILHSFDPHAQKKKLSFFENVPVINQMVNFFNKPDKNNLPQDEYGFVGKSNPQLQSTNRKSSPQENLNNKKEQKINKSSDKKIPSDEKIPSSQEKNTPQTIQENKLSTKIKNTVFAFLTNNAVYQYLINLIFRF